jgi:hypothetical protein
MMPVLIIYQGAVPPLDECTLPWAIASWKYVLSIEANLAAS